MSWTFLMAILLMRDLDQFMNRVWQQAAPVQIQHNSGDSLLHSRLGAGLLFALKSLWKQAIAKDKLINGFSTNV